MIEQIRSGQVRGLAVTTVERSQLASNFPPGANPHQSAYRRKDSRTQGPVAGLAEISLVTHHSNFYVGRTL
jgi:hypothetical protein